MLADFASDTVTKPSQGMRQAMAYAEVGDDVYGEDPTVNRLEETAAELLGHEAALLCPSGSMTNMIGIAAQVPRGAEVLAESRAHILRSELGGHAVLAGVTTRNWISTDGSFNAANALQLVSLPQGYHQVPTAVVSVENTHNFSGGRIADYHQLEILRQETSKLEVAVHVDGARLANAAVATGISLADYGRLADTVSLCLSKGLGAPVGSVLTGSAEVIAEARILRKRYGGGMRQVGILAAAGLYALEHNLQRLAEDNANARAIAEVIAQEYPQVVDPQLVETNIVMLDLTSTPVNAAQLCASALKSGVRMTQMAENEVRIVTHLDVGASQARQAAQIIASLLAG